MRPKLLLLPILFTLSLADCNALGGSEALGGNSADTFTIIARHPTGGSAGIPVTTTVQVTFNGNIDPASVTLGVVALNGEGFGTLTVDGPKLTFTPAGNLDPGSIYAITVSPDVRGMNGHLLGPVSAWGFKTAGDPPPDTLPTGAPRPR